MDLHPYNTVCHDITHHDNDLMLLLENEKHGSAMQQM
jgi:hypothetical protein